MPRSEAGGPDDAPERLAARGRENVTRAKHLWGRFSAGRVWRVWQRYSQTRGSLLAAGITYYAFLSLFPAIAIGFTVFGVLLRGNPSYLEAVRSYVNGLLPGFIKDGSNNGIISLSAPTSATLSATGLVGVVGLLWAGLGWLSAARTGIRAIYGVAGSPGNAVMAKLRDLLVMALFGLGIAVSAVLTVFSSGLASALAKAVGLENVSWLVSLVGFAVGILLDGSLVALMLRLLSGVPLTRRALVQGAAVGGVALTLLKVLGTTVVSGTLKNPVYGSIALVVALLVWLNFICRAILLAAAWTKVVLEDQGKDPEDALAPPGRQPELEVVVERVAPAQPARDPRRERRVNRLRLLTGAALGVGGATLARRLRRPGPPDRSPERTGTPGA